MEAPTITQPIFSELSAAATKYKDWCIDIALPYWELNGLDPKGGGYERLLMDGQPDELSLRRVRVQSRQAYVYAHAGALGWYTHAKAVSDHFWNYLTGLGFQGGETINKRGFKGCAHLLNPDGTLNDGYRDTYAQAFVILAGAWRYIAFKDNDALEVAKATVVFLDTHANADNAGWLEGVPRRLPRRQNPHMHMFEALMALYDATQDQVYLEKASSIFDLFKQHFFDAQTGNLLEYFNQDWTPTKNGGGPIEPGHMMEWCWLLREYANRTHEDVDLYANALYENGIKLGFNADLGLLCDVVNINGQTTTPTYRTWPQTEFIKASMAQYVAGVDGAGENIAHAIETLMISYLSAPNQGGWIDQLNLHGKIVSKYMPASTFYHLFCAATVVSPLARCQ